MNRRSMITATVTGTVLAVIAGFFVGSKIGGQKTEKKEPAVVSSEKSVTYAMNVVVSGVPFWIDTRTAWQVAGETSKEVKTTFGGPANTDAQKQIDEIEALIAKGAKGLVVAPADSAALTPVINKAVDQGIPVITYLVDAPKSKRLTYVSSELETASARIAEYLTDKGTLTGKVIIVFAQSGNEEQEARRRGFEDYLKKFTGFDVVGVVQDNYDEKKGAEQIKPLLIKYPDVKFIFGSNSRAAVGAVSALRETGFSAGQVRVGGWDTDQDVLDLIKQGWVQGSVAQQSTFMTEMMFGILEANRLGYLYPAQRLYKEHDVRPLPDNILVPVNLVTPKNVEGFYPKK